MIKKSYLLKSVGALLIVANLLVACASSDNLKVSSASLTGFCLVTGLEREPVDTEKVVIYSTDNVHREAIMNEEDLEHCPQPPEYYEYIGYVEGISQTPISSNLRDYYRDIDYDERHLPIYMGEQEIQFRKHALDQLKKNASTIGANGIILTSVNFERGITDPYDYALCVAAGWAVYVPPEDFSTINTRINDDKQEKCGKFQIYIEPPQQYEILEDVSSRKDFDYDTDSPSRAINKALEELKKKVIKKGGNALYISKIVRKENTRKAGFLESLLDLIVGYNVDKLEKWPEKESREESFKSSWTEAHSGPSLKPEWYVDRKYVIFGKAIKIPCDN